MKTELSACKKDEKEELLAVQQSEEKTAVKAVQDKPGEPHRHTALLS